MRGVARLLPAAAVAALLVPLGTASPAAADIVDDGEPGLLSIEAQPAHLDAELDPGESVPWLLTARLDAPTDGELLLRVLHSGELVSDPAGLRLRIQECPSDWQPPASPGAVPGCATTPTNVLGPLSFAEIEEDAVWELGGLPDGGSRCFLVTIGFPDAAPAELQGASGEFVLVFSAAGDTEEVVGGPQPERLPPLAFTGVAVAAPLALGLGLGLAGLLLRAAPRRREEAR